MLEHDMCHSCTFEIVEQDRYREFANSDEQKEMFEECGAQLVSLKETNPGVWEIVVNVDTTHPKVDDLMTITDRKGFHYVLMQLPVSKKIGPDQRQGLAQEALRWLDEQKEVA